MDISKLKYYKPLCEKGIIDEQQKGLDDIINTLEEKQFEYLKRLETTKDEGRKDEINEVLNIIDLQLKELAAIKTTLSSGIISGVENDNSTREANPLYEDQKEIKDDEKSKARVNTREKGSSKVIIAIAVLACVIAVSAFAITKSINKLSDTNPTETAEVAEESTDNENSDQTVIGINGIDDGLSAQEQFENQGPEEDILSEGIYVFDITNKTLIDGGLELGDLIISLNGEKVLLFDDLDNVTNRYKPGDEAILVIERNHEQKTINGQFITEAERLAPRTGKGSFKINGRTFEFDYDEGILTLKGE